MQFGSAPIVGALSFARPAGHRLGGGSPLVAAAGSGERSRTEFAAAPVRSGSRPRSMARPTGPRLIFKGDSDAHIVRGLIAILFAIYSGRCADEIVRTDAQGVFRRLGLAEHLTPQRSNGFASMVERTYTDSRRAVSREARRSEPRTTPTNNDPMSPFNLVKKVS